MLGLRAAVGEVRPKELPEPGFADVGVDSSAAGDGFAGKVEKGPSCTVRVAEGRPRILLEEPSLAQAAET